MKAERWSFRSQPLPSKAYKKPIPLLGSCVTALFLPEPPAQRRRVLQ